MSITIKEVDVSDLIPYEQNAKKHPDKQVEHIANSIREFGFRQPLVIDKNNVVVIGHGRLLAAKKLGMKTVPVTYADDLSEEQIKALRLADNKTNESEWDEAIKKLELGSIFDIDMSKFGFETIEEEQNPYTDKIKIPQYEVKGDLVSVSDLFNKEKADELIKEIDAHEELSEEVRAFLRYAAYRHIVFHYREIAEYYASASPEIQKLMEDSALVIIDYNDAIANGYVRLSSRMREMAAKNA